MKKSQIIVGLLSVCTVLLLATTTTAKAEEKLINNDLNIQTDRLEDDQSASHQNTSTVDESIFNQDNTQKLKKAKKQEKATQTKEVQQLFVKKSAKATENDVATLFVNNPAGTNEQVASAATSTTQTTGTDSGAVLVATLFGSAGVLGAGGVASYKIGKRG